MVDDLNGGVDPVDDPSPFLSHCVNSAVIILRDAVRRDERSDYQNVNVVARHFINQVIEDWRHDLCAVPGRGGSDDLLITSADNEQPIAHILGLDAIMQRRRVNAALNLVARVIAIPKPNAQLVLDLNASRFRPVVIASASETARAVLPTPGGATLTERNLRIRCGG